MIELGSGKSVIDQKHHACAKPLSHARDPGRRLLTDLALIGAERQRIRPACAREPRLHATGKTGIGRARAQPQPRRKRWTLPVHMVARSARDVMRGSGREFNYPLFKLPVFHSKKLDRQGIEEFVGKHNAVDPVG